MSDKEGGGMKVLYSNPCPKCLNPILPDEKIEVKNKNGKFWVQHKHECKIEHQNKEDSNE